MTDPIAAITRRVLTGWARRYVGAGALAVTVVVIVTTLPSRPPAPSADGNGSLSRRIGGRETAAPVTYAAPALAPVVEGVSITGAPPSPEVAPPVAGADGAPGTSSAAPPAAPQPAATCPAPLPPAPPPAPLPVADLFGLLSPVGPVTGLFTAETLAGLPLVAPLLPLVTPLVPLAEPALSAAAPVAEQLAGPATAVEQPLIAPLAGPIEAQTPTFLAGQQQFMDTVAPLLAVFGDPNVALAIACGSQAEGAVVGQVQARRGGGEAGRRAGGIAQ